MSKLLLSKIMSVTKLLKPVKMLAIDHCFNNNLNSQDIKTIFMEWFILKLEIKENSIITNRLIHLKKPKLSTNFNKQMQLWLITDIHISKEAKHDQNI